MITQDSNIVITKVGDLVKIVYNGAHSMRMKYTKNIVTGQFVSLLKMDKGVETGVLCNDVDVYKHEMFNTIGGVMINTNAILFDELEKLL